MERSEIIQHRPKLISKSDWLTVRGLGTVQIANSFVRSKFLVGGPLLDHTSLKRDSGRAVSDLDADCPSCWDSKPRTKMITEYGTQGNWMAILILFQEEGKYFDNINFATAVSKFAKIRSLKKQDTVFLQLLEAMEANLQDPDRSPRCYANVAHGLAKLDLRSIDVTGRVLSRLADATVAARFATKEIHKKLPIRHGPAPTLGSSSPELFAATIYCNGGLGLRHSWSLLPRALYRDCKDASFQVAG
jgi:hypothetical protein